MSQTPVNPSAETVRSAIDHPIIDADGHCLEYLPLVREILRDLAGESVEKSFWQTFEQMRAVAHTSARDRQSLAIMRPPWWATPIRNTLDFATATMPRLLYSRLDELGIDFAVVYPTLALGFPSIQNDELRPAESHTIIPHIRTIVFVDAAPMLDLLEQL